MLQCKVYLCLCPNGLVHIYLRFPLYPLGKVIILKLGKVYAQTKYMAQIHFHVEIVYYLLCTICFAMHVIAMDLLKLFPPIPQFTNYLEQGSSYRLSEGLRVYYNSSL